MQLTLKSSSDLEKPLNLLKVALKPYFNSPTTLKDLTKNFDANKKGFFTYQEFSKFLSSIKSLTLIDSEVQIISGFADTSRMAQIYYEELLDYLQIDGLLDVSISMARENEEF